MYLVESTRHSRRRSLGCQDNFLGIAKFNRVAPVKSAEIIDFTPAAKPIVKTKTEVEATNLLATLNQQVLRQAALATIKREEKKTIEFPLDKRAVQKESAPKKDHSLKKAIRHFPNGQRKEYFENNSYLTKDELGRVIEVYSSYGDSISYQWGSYGNLEAAVRVDATGHLESRTAVEKNQVVVRDKDGRVRATGYSMTADSKGCFYLLTLSGHVFVLDLISALHTERFPLPTGLSKYKYITSLFTLDGFRMASMFTCNSMQSYAKDSLFRFYGRDGSLVEFDSESALHDLKPSYVSSTTDRHIKHKCKTPQAITAWQAVHDYLNKLG